MTTIPAFHPAGDTVNLAVTGTTDNVAIGNSAVPHARLYNAGSATVFVRFGGSAQEATAAAGVPLPSGAIEVFTIGQGDTHVAAITASGTATLYVTPGFGI